MKKGFTLVELVIVIIIVGILSIVAVPIYKGYTDRAKETEGKALLGSINTAEKVYFAEMNYFLPVTIVSSENAKLSVDARANKYYKYFKVTTNGQSDVNAGFTAIVGPGDGENLETTSNDVNKNVKPLTLIATSTGTPVISGGVASDSI